MPGLEEREADFIALVAIETAVIHAQGVANARYTSDELRSLRYRIGSLIENTTEAINKLKKQQHLAPADQRPNA